MTWRSACRWERGPGDRSDYTYRSSPGPTPPSDRRGCAAESNAKTGTGRAARASAAHRRQKTCRSVRQLARPGSSRRCRRNEGTTWSVVIPSRATASTTYAGSNCWPGSARTTVPPVVNGRKISIPKRRRCTASVGTAGHRRERQYSPTIQVSRLQMLSCWTATPLGSPGRPRGVQDVEQILRVGRCPCGFVGERPPRVVRVDIQTRNGP